VPEVFEKFSSNVDVSLLDIPGFFKNLFSVIIGSITGGGKQYFCGRLHVLVYQCKGSAKKA